LRITLSSDVLDLCLFQLSHLPRVQADPVKNPREIIPIASVIIGQRTEIRVIVGVPFVVAGMLGPAQAVERWAQPLKVAIIVEVVARQFEAAVFLFGGSLR